jgi:hypothetical protein
MVLLPFVYLLLPIIVPFSLLRERWIIRNYSRTECANCGRPHGKSNIESAVDLAHRSGFDEVDDPMDCRVTCIVLTCESCGVETALPW